MHAIKINQQPNESKTICKSFLTSMIKCLEVVDVI